MNSKCCSKCKKTDFIDNFIKNRNICKDCRNKSCREKYNKKDISNFTQICNKCFSEKSIELFIKNRKICKDCNNNTRRNKYNDDSEHRVKLINSASIFKHKKSIEKQQEKFEKIKKIEEQIGIDNQICKYCDDIKAKLNFRDKRLKCKDCERDEPVEKFKRNIRSRIIRALKYKSKHTIDYLGCSYSDYFNWIFTVNNDYILENHGDKWHIDHVIPLSKFDLDDEEQQLLAFNWRNTMPLSCYENLSKNNKIITSQIEQHYKKLIKYHKENNLILPNQFIELYAKHLDAGSSLEPLLPLTNGNIFEELG